METLIWLVENFGLTTASLMVTFLMMLWLIRREAVARTDKIKDESSARTDSIKTVNDLTILNTRHLLGLQDDYRKLMSLYMETREKLLVEREEANSFKENYFRDKKQWEEERHKLNAEIEELRSRVDGLTKELSAKDEKIASLMGSVIT